MLSDTEVVQTYILYRICAVFSRMPRCSSMPSGILIHAAIWPQHMGRKLGGGCAHLGEGEVGPHLTQCGQGRGLPACSEAEPVVVPANVFRIVSAALSVPGSNAFCERVFSLMNSKWRAERFRASVALIKSELQVCLNFGMKCTDFHGFALTVRKLLNAAASGQKYYWWRKLSSNTTCTATHEKIQ